MCFYASWRKWVPIALCVVFLASWASGGETKSSNDLGSEALSRGDWDSALTHFDEAIRSNPRNATGYWYRGLTIAYGKKDNPDLAISDLTKAIELAPTKAIFFRDRGNVYFFVIGDHSQAIDDYNKAIELDANDPVAYNNRGYAYFCKGDQEKAISDLTAAIRLDPGRAISYANRGLARFQKYEYDGAIADLNASLSIAKTVGALRARSEVYFYLGDLRNAVADIDEAMRLDPKDADTYQQRGSIHMLNEEVNLAVEDFSEAIRLNPNSICAYLSRGNCFAQQSQYDKAIADMNMAVKLDPNSFSPYEWRSVLWIARDDYERGITDIKTAIRLNPTDPARTFEPWPKKSITIEDIQHGERQVQQMLLDRPAMRGHGENVDVLYNWAVRKFAGEDLGQKVFWDKSAPPPYTTCANYSSATIRPGTIRLANNYIDGSEKGKERSFEELWHDAVFELYNIANAEDFWRLVTEAAEGKLTKQEYVAKFVGFEFRAIEKTRSFYIHVFIPWTKEHRKTSHPAFWFLTWHSDPCKGIHFPCATKVSPYWRSYERWYDLTILNSLVGKGDTQKALDLASLMMKQAESNEERGAIYRLSGCCLLLQNNPTSAIEAFDEAIHLNPSDDEAFLNRGEAYATLSKPDRAIADYSEAIRLQPLKPEAYFSRGELREEMGDKEHASEDLAIANRLLKKSESGLKTLSTKNNDLK
jgi:tetratricopeptide (TPR) repeat protein